MPEHFEAKKHAYRQTQDGIVVSFVVHPNDVSAAMAMAPLGTRYMVAFAEIGDDGKPLSSYGGAEKSGTEPLNPLVMPGGKHGDGSLGNQAPPPKDRRSFASLPLSQQAAMRCDDRKFVDFLTATYTDLTDDFDPAEAVREICLVGSRKEFDQGGDGAVRWAQVEGRFQSWLTDQRYAEAAR